MEVKLNDNFARAQFDEILEAALRDSKKYTRINLHMLLELASEPYMVSSIVNAVSDILQDYELSNQANAFVIQELLLHGYKPSKQYIRNACFAGQTEVVRLLCDWKVCVKDIFTQEELDFVLASTSVSTAETLLAFEVINREQFDNCSYTRRMFTV